MKVQELIDRYLVYAKGYYRKPKSRRVTSEYALMRLSTRPLRVVAGGIDVADVTAATIADCRRWLLENKTACCRRTVNAYTSRMIRVFNWGADPEQDLVPDLVGARLKMLRPLAYGRSTARETEGVSAVDRSKVNDLLASLMEPRSGDYAMTPEIKLARLRLATMIELQLETGMRPGEVCSMKLEEIDQSKDVWMFRPAEHKTEHRGKKRAIPLFDNEQFLLRHWLTVSSIKAGPIFGLVRTSYAQALRRALKRAGLEHWSPNQLRHTAGTEVRRDVGLDAAQALLGHSSVRTTEIYAANDLDVAIEALKRFRYGS